MTTRRQFLAGAGALLGAAALGAGPGRGATGGLLLEAAERPQALPCFGGVELPMWTFSAGAFPQIVRLPAGVPMHATLRNSLPPENEHTTIHWHGVRVPNDQDGVPYLTQKPVLRGNTFSYAFLPPDAGTFFFHPHCDTAQQLGRGMAGVLIVEGDETEAFDAEQVLALRDWSVDGPSFGPFFTDEGASRAGTFGTVRSCNGESEPRYVLPASADVRLRILNLDRTRIMQLGIEGAECTVVAVDGMPCPPFPLHGWFTGPAMRFDVIVRTPGAGGEAVLYDYFAPKPVPLVRFAAKGPARRDGPFRPAPLVPNALPEPDLAAAEEMPFVFSATATGSAPRPTPPRDSGLFIDDLCTSQATFWAINKQVWPGRDHSRLPPPLATLRRGKSYIFEFSNVTPHRHPIHLHGHSFKVLSSNKRDIPPHWADTVLLMPKERVKVALVADNPGDWMLHCHIIEHQESGMMGYIRVA